jgi:hypothetical protein
MIENDESVAPSSDEEAALQRHIRCGELPSRVRPEDWVEEAETDPPAHELERSMAIVQNPGRVYET